MLQRVIEDFRNSTRTALQLTALAAAMAVSLLVMTLFICAAAFVVVLRNYGLVQACLSGAAVFFVVALIAAVLYILRKNQAEARAARAAETGKSAMRTALTDPMLVSAGVQLMRTIGFRRLIPILAVGGLALGLMARRSVPSRQAPAE